MEVKSFLLIFDLKGDLFSISSSQKGHVYEHVYEHENYLALLIASSLTPCYIHFDHKYGPFGALFTTLVIDFFDCLQ